MSSINSWIISRLKTYKLLSFLFGCLLFLTCHKAIAMDFELNGDTITMSGHVDRYDCLHLQSLLSKNKIKTIILTKSGGGHADSGYCMGELIRQNGITTKIKGRCASSCSRIWLGGVTRTLDGENARVGLHGNYERTGVLRTDAPGRLRAWIPSYAPNVDRKLMEQWINLPLNKQMMYFYNDRAELCDKDDCKIIQGKNVRNAGLATR